MSLNLKIDKSIDEAVYFQLYQQIRELIKNGALEGDSKLPSIRVLSKELGVNSVTVVSAYNMLEKDKLIYKREGSGTYVIPKGGDLFLNSEQPIYFEPGELDTDFEYGDEYIDFSTSAPDPILFSIKDFRHIMNEVLEEDGAKAFMYQRSMGYTPLRNALKDYAKGYGIDCTPDDVYVVSGAQQGIDIIAKALVKSGECVFVESPTYSGALAAFKSRGAKLVEVPLQEDGPGIKELDRLVKLFKPVLFYAMPNFHNPTGSIYSERKKKYMLLLAKKYDFRILEDDYSGDLNYTDSKLLPVKAYDNNDRVIYLKSFSKIFMPGFRLAYMVVPEDIRKKAADAKIASDISTSGLMQRILCKYIENGILEKHITYLRKEFSIRYLEMVRGVKKCLRGASLFEPKGGLNLWIKLPEGVASLKLYERCKEKKVIFSPGTFYYNDERGQSYIRMSFAATDIEKIWTGISIISLEAEKLRT
ncbi:MAG: PLP-dependent aminotransferase family protein [Lutispora sp.]|nr:PLP-dependent aminotransferase family protein [Lutispora sp.]